MTETHKRITVLGLAVWLLASIFFLYEFFLRTFVGTVANEIMASLKINAETFALVGSGYYISYGLMQIPVGLLADRFGVKRNLLFATLVCAVATFFFAYSYHFYSAFISRLFMGFGSSFAFVCLLAVALNWFPRKNFAFFVGASQFIGTAGPLLAGGPLEMIVQHYQGHWRLVLALIGSFGILLFLLILIIVRDKPKAASERELLLLERKITIWQQIKLLVSNSQAWFIGSYSMFVYVSVALLGAIWGTDYLEARGMPVTVAAYVISTVWVGYAIGCPLLGWISDRIKRRKPLLYGSALLGLVMINFILFMPGDNPWLFGVLFFLLGIAATGQSVGFAAMSDHVERNIQATAMGLNNGFITMGGAFLPPLVSLMIHTRDSHNHLHLVQSQFTHAFIALPFLYLIGFIIATVFIRESFCRPQKEAVVVQRSSL